MTTGFQDNGTLSCITWELRYRCTCAWMPWSFVHQVAAMCEKYSKPRRAELWDLKFTVAFPEAALVANIIGTQTKSYSSLKPLESRSETKDCQVKCGGTSSTMVVRKNSTTGSGANALLTPLNLPPRIFLRRAAAWCFESTGVSKEAGLDGGEESTH